MLQVDTGAVGGRHAFSLGQVDCTALALSMGANVTVTDASGHSAARQTVWVQVGMPALNLRQPVLAVCYPSAPGRYEGLVRLPFLSGHFSSWGADKGVQGDWWSHVEREAGP